MQLEILYNNFLMTFILVFIKLFIFLWLLTFFYKKAIKYNKIKDIGITKSLSIKTIFLVSISIATLYAAFSNSNQPRMKIEPTLLFDGSQLTEKDIIKNEKGLIDSPTKQELELDTKLDEQLSNKKLENRGIDLNH